MLYENKNKRGVKFVNSTKLNEETAMMNYIGENITNISLGTGRTISGTGISCKIISVN